MSSPRRLRFACLFSATLAGCASTYPAPDTTPPRDFSGAGAPSDLGSGVGGNGGAGGSGGSGVDGGSADLAAPAQVPPVDMAVKAAPPDLMPACVPSIADDGGVAPGLHLAAPGPSHTLYAARFDGAAWTPIATTAGAQVADVALATVGSPARPLVLARMSDATLDATSYDPCSGAYPALAPIRDDAWSALRPALIAGSSGADAVFRGGFDQKLYWSHFDGSAWSVIATDGNLLTDQIPTAIYVNGAVHSVFNNVSQSQTLFDGTLQSSGGVGAALAGSSNFGPAAVSSGGNSYVLFTGMNTHVYWLSSAAPATAHDVCEGQTGCYVLSEAAPSLSLDGDGGLISIYRGTDHHLYSTSLPAGGATWTTVLPVSGSETTTLAVALSAGIGSAEAEAVYVRAGDGYPRHARLLAGAWQTATVDTVALTGAAALAVSR